jgi:hypothetical protein
MQLRTRDNFYVALSGQYIWGAKTQGGPSRSVGIVGQIMQPRWCIEITGNVHALLI